MPTSCVLLCLFVFCLFNFFFSPAPSAAPANLNVTAIHSRALIISWVALADEEWNGDQVGLRIEVLELESGNRRIFTVSNVAATTLVVNSLYPCYTYRCRVVAYNSVGSGPSANTSVTMPEDGRLQNINE